MGLQGKERIRLLDDLRALLPELLLVLGSVEQLHPPPDVSSRVDSVRSQLEALVARARAMEEATDCIPAADKGRQERGTSRTRGLSGRISTPGEI